MGVRIKGNDVDTGETTEVIVDETSAAELGPRVDALEAKVAELESRIAALEGAAP